MPANCCKWCKRMFAELDGGDVRCVRRCPTGAQCCLCVRHIARDPIRFDSDEAKKRILEETPPDIK